jgi:hypothetical protein
VGFVNTYDSEERIASSSGYENLQTKKNFGDTSALTRATQRHIQGLSFHSHNREKSYIALTG